MVARKPPEMCADLQSCKHVNQEREAAWKMQILQYSPGYSSIPISMLKNRLVVQQGS